MIPCNLNKQSELFLETKICFLPSIFQYRKYANQSISNPGAMKPQTPYAIFLENKLKSKTKTVYTLCRSYQKTNPVFHRSTARKYHKTAYALHRFSRTYEPCRTKIKKKPKNPHSTSFARRTRAHSKPVPASKRRIPMNYRTGVLAHRATTAAPVRYPGINANAAARLLPNC